MTTGKRQRKAKSAAPAKTMADYAMSFDGLGLWMSARAQSTTLLHPQATSLSMLDGAIAAIVAGPISMIPEEWVCPLLGVDPDDFNHDTETFSAIAATLMRHNAISNTLSTKPESFKPLFLSTPDGEVDPQPWCRGFYAVMKLKLSAWSRLLNETADEHRFLLPILLNCIDSDGRPTIDPNRRNLTQPKSAQESLRDIPLAVEAMRQFWMPTRFKRGA
ncbi:hypothetical+protein [Methylocapsa aurea]|uniref:UPF0149 family protein n=1 Tax=Methylocapsa aurea TaxID=663610 RepID=UPI003D18B455